MNMAEKCLLAAELAPKLRAAGNSEKAIDAVLDYYLKEK